MSSLLDIIIIIEMREGSIGGTLRKIVRRGGLLKSKAERKDSTHMSRTQVDF